MNNLRFNSVQLGINSKSLRQILVAVVGLFLLPRCSENDNQLMRISGTAQGTTYHISYLSPSHINYQSAIDSLLREIDSSLSTYLPVSIISRINQNDSSVFADKYFTDVFNKSIQVSEKTGGLFDVTVAPVINAWGFGFTKRAIVDSSLVDSLLRFVGYKNIRIVDGRIIKARSQIMVDFNAIAQGYTVDVLASYLESMGVSNYMVELGGEVIANGKKNTNEYWRVGIDKPNETSIDDRPLQAIVKLKNKALATSGNYRKFYIENGKKYAHIVDPRTGYPARHNLLSATVISEHCMTADAYATAFMVMGLDRSKQFLSENPELGLEVYFIYDENGIWKTYNSEGLKEWIEEIH